jgi:hypothetical protein
VKEVSRVVKGGFTLAFFQEWGWGSEVLLEQVQSNFSFQNKYIIVLPWGHQVDNNTFLEVCIFKSLTRYADDGYGKNAYILIIIK